MKTSLPRYIVLAFIICSSAFTSCSTDNSAEQAQAKVDSIVLAKTTMLKTVMKHNNDSLIDAMALARADSMMPATTTQPTVPVKK